MKHNVIFLSSFKNMDMLATAKKCVDMNISHLVIKVMDGQKSVNELTDNGKNRVVEKLLEHCTPQNVGVGVYVTIAGGDVGTEYRKLVNRIEGFANQISSITIEVTDSWAKRKDAEVVKYVSSVKERWPDLPVHLLDTTTQKVKLAEWIRQTDQKFVLCASDDDAIFTMIYRNYIRYFDSQLFKTYAALDQVFCPVLGISDIPVKLYKFSANRLIAAYKIIQDKTAFQAVGLFEWTPKGVEGLGDDGPLGIDKTVKAMVWTKGDSSVNEDSQPDITEPTPLTLEQRIERLEKLHNL